MNRYYTILILGGITFGTAAIFIRFSSLSPSFIAFSRFFVAGLILSRGRLSLKEIAGKWRPGLLLAAHMILFILSVYRTTIIDSTVLVSTSPLFSLALAHFVGIRTTKKELIAGLLAFLGIVIMNYPLQAGLLLGNFLAIISALTIALYTIILAKGSTEDPMILTSQIYLASSIFSFPLVLLQGIGNVNMTSLLSLLGLIALPTLIGHTSVIYSSGHVKPQHIEIIGLLEPVVASVLAVPLFGQIPTSTEVLGSAMVIVSIIVILWRE